MQFVSERKQIALMADEKSPARISHRLLAINRSEVRDNMSRFDKIEQKKEQMSSDEIRIWELLKKKNIPIASLDERWLKLFPESEKTPAIKRLEKELMELLKRQGKANTDLKDIRVVRDKLTQSVLDTAEDTTIPMNKRLKKQATSQRLIVEAREKQENLEREIDELPERIKEANSALIFESVRVCYQRINRNKQDIQLLEQWIEETRAKLKERVVIKQDKEITNEEIYTYLHGMLGAGVMEAFDEKGN